MDPNTFAFNCLDIMSLPKEEKVILSIDIFIMFGKGLPVLTVGFKSG